MGLLPRKQIRSIVLISLFLVLLIGVIIWKAATLQRPEDEPSNEAFAEMREPAANPNFTREAPSEMPEHVQETIENLFRQIEEHPELRDKLLKELKRLLQESFAGQEDCWSCHGSDYFDRYDKIAGKGESRKPLGFRDWLDQGDEAYESHNLELARKFYSRALEVMDERLFQDDENPDHAGLERIRDRCQELDCR